MARMQSSRWIGSLWALASACVEAPATGTSTSPLGPGDGTYEQGRFVLGELADALPGRTASTQFAVGRFGILADGTTTTPVSVTDSTTAGSCLSATAGGPCAGSEFDNMILPPLGTGMPSLKVLSSLTFATLDPGQTMTGYVLQYLTGGPPASYCVGDRLAYPMAGEVDLDSGIDRTAPYITFACSAFLADGTEPAALIDRTGNGVLAKTSSWGFVPGADGLDHTSATVTGESLQTVAFGAGRANYCRDGVSHTFDATSIEIRDFVTNNLVADVDPATYPGPSPTASPTPVIPQQFSLESVWKRGNNDTDPKVLCFSRLRWQTLPVNPRCSSTTPIEDPRHLAGATFCDAANYTWAMNHDAAIAIRSQRNDLGLWRWSHRTNGDQYATTVGFYGGITASTPPAPNYVSLTSAPPEHLGTIFTIVGKTIFQANYPGQAGTFVELRSCQRGTDWATDVDTWLTPRGFTSLCKTEGFVWSTPPVTAILDPLRMTAIELRRWSNGTDFVASTTWPGTGYTSLPGPPGLIGYIVAPATW